MGTFTAALGQVIPDAKKEKVEKVNDVKVKMHVEPCERFSWILGCCNI